MVDIEFHTVNAGWIEGRIITDEKDIYFSYSWITNFLDDLLKAVLYVGGYIDDTNLEKFTAESEPAVDDWLLSKKENELMIDIISFEDDTRKELIENDRLQCDYHDFIKNLFNALTKLIKKIGLYAYRIEWDAEFPLALYLRLYDIVKDTHFFDLKEIPFEESYRQGQTTDVNNELALLTDIFNICK